MPEHPLQSINAYSRFVAAWLNRSTVIKSTVAVWSESRYTGVAEGEVLFEQGFRLRLREELDFADQLITAYGYEVQRGAERLYWYDDFPHPHDSTLVATHPHHKHVPPDIKHNRLPAPDLSFTQPNLPFIIAEIEAQIGV